MDMSSGAYRKQDRCTKGFWWGDLREGDHLENLSVRGRILLKLIFKKWDVEAWPELIWFRIRTGGEHL
jgi:hypothetical protein